MYGCVYIYTYFMCIIYYLCAVYIIRAFYIYIYMCVYVCIYMHFICIYKMHIAKVNPSSKWAQTLISTSSCHWIPVYPMLAPGHLTPQGCNHPPVPGTD